MRAHDPRRSKIVFVLGSQRSGTTALVHSLGQDEAVRVEDEHVGNKFYEHYLLRNLSTIGPLLKRIPRRVAFKPVAEINRQTVGSLLANYEEYRPAVAWIYREPLNVWASWVIARDRWNHPAEHLDTWIERWTTCNADILKEARNGYRGRVAVVRYEDLCQDSMEFGRLCAFLGIKPINCFFHSSTTKSGIDSIPPDEASRICSACEPIVVQLEEFRREQAERLVVPPRVKAPMVSYPVPRPRLHELRRAEPISVEATEDNTLMQPAPKSFISACLDSDNVAYVLTIDERGDTLRVSQTPDGNVRIANKSLEGGWPILAVSPDKWLTSGRFASIVLEIRASEPTEALLMLGSARSNQIHPRAFHKIRVTQKFQRHVFDIRVLRSEQSRLRVALAGGERDVEIRELAFIPYTRRFFEDHSWNGAGCATSPSSLAHGIRIQPWPASRNADEIQILSREQRVAGYQQIHLFFWARAEAPRPLQVGVCDRHRWGADPFYLSPVPIVLNSELQRFHLEFPTSAGSTNVNAIFSLGDSDTPVEIANVRFLSSLARSSRLFSTQF